MHFGLFHVIRSVAEGNTKELQDFSKSDQRETLAFFRDRMLAIKRGDSSTFDGPPDTKDACVACPDRSSLPSGDPYQEKQKKGED